MEISSVRSSIKSVVLGVVVLCGAWVSTALAAAPMTTHAAALVSRATAATSPASSSTGFELDYYHADSASKTYAIRLKNGLQATFDFGHDTATLYFGPNLATFPLEQALVQANGGNVEAASEMYDQMYQEITSPHADAIMAYVGTGSYGTLVNPNPPQHGFGSVGDLGLWSTPTGSDCWPVPYPCNQWGGGLLSDWGPFNQWWGSGLGDPPPTSEPPRPDGCAPNDIDCIIWEHDRKDACDGLFLDSLEDYGMAATAGAACGTALGTAGGFGVSAAACVGALAGFTTTHLRAVKDDQKCHTPYPG